MQHSGVATLDLNALIAKNAATYKNKKLIVCMQEPYIRRRKIKLDTNVDLFYLSIPGRVTRSAIAASKGLNLVLVPSLSDPDCTTCLMETEAGRKKTLIVSLYCDINKEIITNTMLNIINYRNRTGAELFIQCDSNAHSDLWGCAETNTRGNELETFMYENDLVVQNVGQPQLLFLPGANR